MEIEEQISLTLKLWRIRGQIFKHFGKLRSFSLEVFGQLLRAFGSRVETYLEL